MNASDLARGVRAASIGYLALPSLLFVAGTLRPLFGALLTVLLLAGIGRWLVDDPGSRERGPELPLGRLALAALPVLGVLAVSGVAGVGFQNTDWHKHQAVVRALMRQPWPVAWSTGADPAALVYYVAYYLPAAIVGKLGGWLLANAFLLAWTALGLVLCVAWLALLAGGSPLVCGLLLALFAGLDAVDYALAHGAPAMLRGLWEGRFFEYSNPWFQYSGSTALLFWVPGQALAGWLATALLLDAVHRGARRFPAALLVALVPLWSAFAALGLAALAWVAVLFPRAGWRETARRQATLANAAGLVLLCVVLLYYAARLAPLDLPAAFTVTGSPPNGFQPAVLDLDGRRLLGFLGTWALFCAIEFGVLAALLVWADPALRRPGGRAALFGSALLTLLVLPFFRYGYYNDLAMRASIPAVFALVCWTAAALHRRTPRAAVVGLALVVAIGALTPLAEVRRQIARQQARGSWIALTDEARVWDLFRLHVPYARQQEGFDFVRQYLGSTEAFFFRALAPPLRLRPAAQRAQLPEDP